MQKNTRQRLMEFLKSLPESDIDRLFEGDFMKGSPYDILIHTAAHNAGFKFNLKFTYHSDPSEYVTEYEILDSETGEPFYVDFFGTNYKYSGPGPQFFGFKVND
jgi:hypothetical protein